VGQTSVAAKTYDVTEAYQIYSLLLPQEESYHFAKGTLIIQEDTVAKRDGSEPCVTPETAIRFKDAIADYGGTNREQWLLQRHFQIEKPYELVSSDTIRALFEEGGWDGFYKRHAESGGYIILSAVGFNKGKTLAIVYAGSSCGGLCGSWRFHLFEKMNSKWKEVPGITCSMVS
jgi:hypothetical protein